MIIHQESLQYEPAGRVGAFWVLPDLRIIGEACPLSNGPSGHHWLWEKLIKPAMLLGRIYTTVPRGHVLYRITEARYVVLAAPEIVSSPQARRAVEMFYGLLNIKNGPCWEIEAHYVTQPDLLDEGDEDL